VFLLFILCIVELSFERYAGRRLHAQRRSARIIKRARPHSAGPTEGEGSAVLGARRRDFRAVGGVVHAVGSCARTRASVWRCVEADFSSSRDGRANPRCIAGGCRCGVWSDC
jgi:hypothetical protein